MPKIHRINKKKDDNTTSRASNSTSRTSGSSSHSHSNSNSNSFMKQKHASTNGHKIPERTYKPYATTSLESPLWHLILQPWCSSATSTSTTTSSSTAIGFMQPILAALYKFRGILAGPMRMKVVPNFLANFLPPHLAATAVGDLILLVPILIFILRGAHFTFVAPSLSLSGYCSAYCIFVAYLTASKSNSLFTWLFGIPYERLIGLHWFSSVSGAVLGGCHCYVSYVFGGDDNGDSKFSQAVAGGTPNLAKFLFDGVNNWSGTILQFSMVAMVLMSFFQFLRRYAFNLWYILHVVFGVLILIMLFLHSVPSAAFVTAWWALDLLVRYAVMAGLKNVTRAKLRVLRGSGSDNENKNKADIVELIVQKPEGFQYNAGQFVRLAVPAISAVEFHPISIASAPDEAYLVLQIRNLGDWTERLCELAETTDFTDVLLEGPYGACSVDVENDDKYDMVLCISGGIGVTPCQSIGKHLLLKHRQEGRKLKLLNFVWAVRDLQMVQDIPPLFLENNENIKEDYSKSSPDYQRMMQRVDFYRKGTLDDENFKLSTTVSSDNSSQLRRRPAVVQADIYHTGGSSDSNKRQTNNDVESSSGRLSLPYNLHNGRPDLDQIFEDMRNSAIAMNTSNICVIGCGPIALMEAVQEACRKYSSSVLSVGDDVVFFDFHKEHFEL